MHESLVIISRIFESRKIRFEFMKADDVADVLCNSCKEVEANLVIMGRRRMGMLKGVYSQERIYTVS
jgi:hypothetical protein